MGGENEAWLDEYLSALSQSFRAHGGKALFGIFINEASYQEKLELISLLVYEIEKGSLSPSNPVKETREFGGIIGSFVGSRVGQASAGSLIGWAIGGSIEEFVREHPPQALAHDQDYRPQN